MTRVLAIFGLLSLACSTPARAERFVLAWPPSFYDSAELIVHRGPAASADTLQVGVRARGLSVDEELAPGGVLRIPLPVAARCAVGIDDCAISVESAADDLRVTLQSPDTRGVPDTLARTAHDTVRAPSAQEAGRRFVVLAAANSPDFAEALSFASVVAWEESVHLTGFSSCLGAIDESIEPGEVLTLACAGPGEDLSGTLLSADARVAVFSGNRSAPLPAVPGSGWSADFVFDASPALEALESGATWLVPPLPRRATHAGLGDLLRCAAGEALSVRIRDESGLDETRELAAGEQLELDSAAPGGDEVLRLDADGPLACWQLSKSRAHRGTGDAAAIPVVPREFFTTADAVFLPDGYGEGSHLVIVAEAGTTVLLDGTAVTGFTAAPGGELDWVVVELSEPVLGEGRLLSLSGDAPFGAWFFGQGGYKAHGLTAARARPAPPATVIRRSDQPQGLEPVAETTASRWCDPDPGALFFYEVDGDWTLVLERDAGFTCLSWTEPGGG